MKGQDGLAREAATLVAAGHWRAYFTGVPGNYLLESLIDAGRDPDHLRLRDNLARGPGAQPTVPINI